MLDCKQNINSKQPKLTKCRLCRQIYIVHYAKIQRLDSGGLLYWSPFFTIFLDFEFQILTLLPYFIGFKI